MLEKKMLGDIFLHWVGEPIRSYQSVSKRVHFITTQSGREWVLKAYAEQENALREKSLLIWLAERGLPTPRPVPKPGGDFFLPADNQLYAVFTRLVGAPFNRRNPSGALSKVVFEYGRAAARLHQELVKCDTVDVPVADLYQQATEWSAPLVRKLLQTNEIEEFEGFIRELEIWRPLFETLPTQVIHRDFHPDNILFTGLTYSGWIDFELAVRGPRLFDPIYCFTALLSESTTEEDRLRVLQLLPELFAGYESLAPFTKAEGSSVFPMVIVIQFLFIAHFLNQKMPQAARGNWDMLRWITAHRCMVDQFHERNR